MIARIRCVSVSLSHRRITIISVANSQSCCREGIIVGDRQVGQIQINVLSTCVCQWVHVRHSINILSELMPLTLLSTHCAVYMLYGQHWRSLYVGDQRPCEHEPSCERCLRDVDVSLTPGWCLSEAPTIGQLRYVQHYLWRLPCCVVSLRSCAVVSDDPVTHFWISLQLTRSRQVSSIVCRKLLDNQRGFSYHCARELSHGLVSHIIADLEWPWVTLNEWIQC